VEGRPQEVQSARYRIGAASDNDLTIPDDPFLSDYHAEIVYSDGRYRIRDGQNGIPDARESTNGTFVNGQRVKEAALNTGDVILLGKCEFRIGQDRAENTDVR
jgi:pSer/pThr/pTyr-binding forkhead associated (FHA) protein